MNKKTTYVLIITAIVAIAILAAFWAVIIHQPPQFQRRFQPPNPVVGDFEFYYVASTIVSTINIVLLSILIVTYVSIYLKTKSPFTIGLIIFALVFLMKDLLSNSFFVTLFRFRAYGLGPFAFLPDLLEMAAISILLYLSVRY